MIAPLWSPIWSLLFGLALATHAFPAPGGCADPQVTAWLRASLRPVVQRATQVLATQNPAISANLRLAFERHVRECDERAHGAERHVLERRIEEQEAATAQELKGLGEALPRALERCAGPSRDACVVDVRRAYAMREQALRTTAQATREDLTRQREGLGVDLGEAYRLLDSTDVLDAYAKGFLGKMGGRPGLALKSITINEGDDYRSSWKVSMDLRYDDQNFEYLTRIYLNLYQRVTKVTLAQVRKLAAAQVTPPPERIVTVNNESLDEALADHRSGRDVTWLSREANGVGQVGVLDAVTLKTLRTELRPQ